MDAMQRGAVVITSPVGQAIEIIEHEKNGFLCQTDEEFTSILKSLAAHPAELQRLRIASHARILESRPPAVIHAAVEAALDALLATSSTR
jgi:glycosyltransferase involved in cell wall biosynthesis